MRTQKLVLLAALAILASSALLARPALADVEPWHNPDLALDVDDNTLVQPRDALLIINRLTRPITAEPATSSPPPVDLSTVFYWDTTNDGDVSARDALIVINRLIATTAVVPEPGSIALAGMGLTVLAGCAWRQRRRRATELGFASHQ